MRLFLHMGPHKTGTTSLQAMLRRNADALGDGIKVIVPGSESPIKPLAQVMWRFSMGRADWSEVQAEVVETTQMLRATDAETLIVSHENLCGAMMGSGTETAFYPHLSRFMDCFDRHLNGVAPEYVFYQRDSAQWLKSVHNQVVKQNLYADDLTHFLAGTDQPDWSGIAGLSRPGRQVHLFDLADEPDRARPGQQLLRLVGLDDDRIAALKPVPDMRNESLSVGALEFMRIINALRIDQATRRQIMNQVIARPELFDTLSRALMPQPAEASP
ncbi:MAG: hypothetical protein AAFN94_05000 [Pseudomonadota bacterium]